MWVPSRTVTGRTRTEAELLLLLCSLRSHNVTLNTDKVKKALQGAKRTDVETCLLNKNNQYKSRVLVFVFNSSVQLDLTKFIGLIWTVKL